MKRMDNRTANYLASDSFFFGLKQLNNNFEKHLIDLYTCNLHAAKNLDIVTLPGRRSSGTSDKGKEQQEYRAFIRFANEHYPMYKIVSFVEVVESTMPFKANIKHRIVEDLDQEDFAVKAKEALTMLYEAGIGEYTDVGLIDSITRQYQPYFDHPYVVGDTPLEDFKIRKLVKQRNISSFLEGFFKLNLDKLRTEFENKKNMDEYYKYFN